MRKTLLAIGMALASCAAIAVTEVVDGIEWHYTVAGGVATVGVSASENAVSKDTTGAITIPSMLGGCPVTSIGASAFDHCSGLTNVTISSSVTSIGNMAFDGCSGLTSVSIPNSVTSIGPAAFRGCFGLTSVTIPNGVTNIGYYAFEYCSRLTSVTIPDSMTNIRDCAFWYCTGLETIVIPSSVTNVGEYAFCDSNGLKDVTVPGWSCWLQLSSVTNLVISDGTTSIMEGAFRNCNKLANVTIPDSVTNIGANAFSDCGELTRVTIPDSITDIGGAAFSGCGGMVAFAVGGDNPNYKAEGGLLLTKDGKTLVAGVNGDVTIPSSVTTIDDYAFSGRSELTSVTIPSSVTSIGGSAFRGCSGLKNVTLEGDAPMSGDEIFLGTPLDMVVHVKGNSSGWTQWNGRVIRFDADGGSGTASTSVNVNMTITNVVVHYIQTSELSPMAAPVTKDVGIVNVMTEVKGGNVSIPESWATNWPSFKATFGEDFSDALTRQTGKLDAGGKPMMVWQDFVAGTDPTDKDDVFKASVTMVGGKPVVSYTPELSEAEKAKRKYTTWGKVKLHDEKWIEIPAGREADYNFFKVTVEMR